MDNKYIYILLVISDNINNFKNTIESIFNQKNKYWILNIINNGIEECEYIEKLKNMKKINYTYINYEEKYFEHLKKEINKFIIGKCYYFTLLYSNIIYENNYFDEMVNNCIDVVYKNNIEYTIENILTNYTNIKYVMWKKNTIIYIDNFNINYSNIDEIIFDFFIRSFIFSNNIKYIQNNEINTNNISNNVIEEYKYNINELNIIKKNSTILVVLLINNNPLEYFKIIDEFIVQNYINFILYIIYNNDDDKKYINMLMNYYKKYNNIIFNINDDVKDDISCLNESIDYFLNNNYRGITFINNKNEYLYYYLSYFVCNFSDFIYASYYKYCNKYKIKYIINNANEYKKKNNGTYPCLWSYNSIKKLGLFNINNKKNYYQEYLNKTFKFINNINYITDRVLINNNDIELYENNSNFDYPKILHLFWYGKLPFLNFITLLSFLKYHEKWKINIYTTNLTNKNNTWNTFEQTNNPECKFNYFNYLYLYDNVEIINIDEIVMKLKINKLNFIHQSDIIRIYALYTYGGIWSDFDIIYTKNIEEVFISNKDCIFQLTNKCGNKYYPIGMFLSNKKSLFFKKILDKQLSLLNNDKLGYETFGAGLFELFFIENNINDIKEQYNLDILGKNNYLFFEWYELEDIYIQKKTILPEEAVGIHWFNGAQISKEYIKNFDLEKFSCKTTIDLLIEPYIEDLKNIVKQNKKSISIVMAYHNRLDLLLQTLYSIEKQNYNNLEIIIVNDNSPDEDELKKEINNLNNLNIKIIDITEKEKGDRKNPSYVFNKGFKECNGEIIIIQNPESYHVGSIIDFVNINIKKREYIVFSAFNINSIENNNIFLNIDDKTYDSILSKKEFTENNDYIWVQHPYYINNKYHFCSAIYRNDLDNINYFDNEYNNGYCFDDDDIVFKIEYNGKYKIKEIFPNNNIFIANLYHTPNISTGCGNKDIYDKWSINKNYFEKKVNNINSDFNYPRIMHLFWYGKLPLLNYITLLSFIKYHPSWVIKIYTTTENNNKILWDTGEQQNIDNNDNDTLNDYFYKLKSHTQVNIINVDDISKELGINKLNYIHQSDIIRIYALYKYGGLWSDFDIIYIKNIELIFSNYTKDIIFKIDIKNDIVSYYPIGLFLSNPNSKIFKKILDKQLEILNSNENIKEYQQFGSSLLNEIFGNYNVNKEELENNFNITILDKFYYLPYEFNELDMLYENKITSFHKNTVGIHWFNGDIKSKKYIKNIFDNNREKNTIDLLIQEYI